MSRRSLLTLASAAAACFATALVVHFHAATPSTVAARPAGGGSTSEATFTATPCPTGKVPDTYHGSGCGTPTATPTSVRPPAEPEIVLYVHGARGWVNVVLGEPVTGSWV